MDQARTRERGYQCQRCGAVTEGPEAKRRYCALCGVHEVEVERVMNPAAPDRDGHRLPAAV